MKTTLDRANAVFATTRRVVAWRLPTLGERHLTGCLAAFAVPVQCYAPKHRVDPASANRSARASTEVWAFRSVKSNPLRISPSAHQYTSHTCTSLVFCVCCLMPAFASASSRSRHKPSTAASSETPGVGQPESGSDPQRVRPEEEADRLLNGGQREEEGKQGKPGTHQAASTVPAPCARPRS